MKRKIIGLLMVIAMCFTLIPTNYIFAAQVITANKTGNIGSYDYELYLTNMSSSQIQDEINRTNNLLKGITGKDVHLIRPPYLATNQTVTSSVNAPLITCSVDSKDWDGASKDQIISNVLNNVKDGSIVLMHETYDTTDGASYTFGCQLGSGSSDVTVSNVTLK